MTMWTQSPFLLLPVALRASLSLSLLLALAPLPVSPSPIGIASTTTSRRPEVNFTPPDCLQGRPAVDLDHLPTACDHTWFVVAGADNRAAHATRSPTARAVMSFTGVAVSWLASPVTTVRGTADIFLDARHVGRVQLSPDNTRAGSTSWSAAGLDPNVMHNLTIVPVGDDVIYVGELAVVPSPNDNEPASDPPSSVPLASILAATSSALTTMPPVLALASQDPASGTVISLASIGSVALVVLICGGCFILGKRQKSPGFHMPTVLVDIEGALEGDGDGDGGDSPTSTRGHDPFAMGGRTIRTWREEGAERGGGEMGGESDAYDDNRYRYPPSRVSFSRPPSYRSGKDALYRLDSLAKSRRPDW